MRRKKPLVRTLRAFARSRAGAPGAYVRELRAVLQLVSLSQQVVVCHDYSFSTKEHLDPKSCKGCKFDKLMARLGKISEEE